MASRKTTEMKQRLLEARDALLREREALENQIRGVEQAIALIGDDEAGSSGAGRKRNRSTKAIVLDLLKEVGTTGLNATTAVNLADARGLTLDRNSVSSLLSRLKKDEIAVYDGEKYRLKEYVPKPDLDALTRSVFDEPGKTPAPRLIIRKREPN